MSLSKYLTNYLSDTESGEITSTDDEETIDNPATRLSSASLSLEFCAHLSTSLSNVMPYHGIIFDIVESNDEGTYNQKTGRFTASFKGIYVFFITLTSTEKLRATISFMHKFCPVYEAKVKEMEQSVEGFTTKTMAAILYLDIGDKVWVLNTTKTSEVSRMMEPYYTSFSGGLVEKHGT